MERCKTCKWWDIGRCDQQFEPHARAMLEVAECDAEFTAEPKPAGLLARTNGESCVILTGPEFGCVHHQPKEEPQDVLQRG